MAVRVEREQSERERVEKERVRVAAQLEQRTARIRELEKQVPVGLRLLYNVLY